MILVVVGVARRALSSSCESWWVSLWRRRVHQSSWLKSSARHSKRISTPRIAHSFSDVKIAVWRLLRTRYEVQNDIPRKPRGVVSGVQIWRENSESRIACVNQVHCRRCRRGTPMHKEPGSGITPWNDVVKWFNIQIWILWIYRNFPRDCASYNCPRCDIGRRHIYGFTWNRWTMSSTYGTEHTVIYGSDWWIGEFLRQHESSAK
jgi:hypothetical protein